MRRAENCNVLIKDLLRYGYWAGPRSDWLMRATATLGWRLSHLVRPRLGRPRGALYWPLGLGLLSLNSPCSPLHCLVEDLLEHAITGLESKPTLHVEAGGVLYAALGLYEKTGNDRGIGRVQRLALQLLERQGGNDGSLPYAVGRDEILIDTLGMICPMLARLGRITDDARYTDVALRQLGSFLSRGVDESSGWPWHGYHRNSGESLGVAGWGRGMGWMMLGMIDMTIELPFGEVRDSWTLLADGWMMRLAQVQRSDGHWPWLLSDRSGHIDSSVAAMLGYSAARLAFGNHAQSMISMKLLQLAGEGIERVTDSRGRVQQASGEAGGCGDYSQDYGNHLWVQGPAVALQSLQSRQATKPSNDHQGRMHV